jgi:hypothetical protein
MVISKDGIKQLDGETGNGNSMKETRGIWKELCPKEDERIIER